MQVKILKSFSTKLARQVAYIASDKPQAAMKFKNDILKNLKALSEMPYTNKKSIYFSNSDIRDLVLRVIQLFTGLTPSNK